ncbi:MAG: 5-bromo-4-chloroindolyl phosphate hydrolysis family protein [Pseudomonadota bacterium]
MSNAKRFGGAHSPGGAGRPAPEVQAKAPKSPLAGRKVRKFSWRVLGLYIAPSALILTGLEAIFSADLPAMLWSWGGYAALMLAAWLTAQGLKAEEAFNARVIAKPPAFPRKLVAAILAGLAVAGISFAGIGVNVLVALVYGAIAVGAHIVAFGLDPMKAKGVDGIADAELERVAAKIERAEAVVAETVAAAETLRDRKLTDRIDALAYSARDILREIQSDPRDLTRSRRFLSVHLVGLRDATVKYADAARKGAAGKGAAGDLRDRYADLLGDLETSFEAQRTALLSNDQTDLEVEIDVLRDRLKS